MSTTPARLVQLITRINELKMSTTPARLVQLITRINELKMSTTNDEVQPNFVLERLLRVEH